jgi:tetratricopeptide (TPR) repeat protein
VVPLPGVPTERPGDRTESHRPPTAYGFFLDGCDAEDRGDDRTAQECYRRALDLDGSLAAAHTNLGNIHFRRGDRERARACFELALELEPTQPEARYNLGNLLDDLGDTEQAIAELRRVTATHPEFADAHYNLGLLLARVGGYAQAQKHLETYLRLDTDSEWAARGRQFLTAIA